jgi:hypothetical protein
MIDTKEVAFFLGFFLLSVTSVLTKTECIPFKAQLYTP